MLHKKSYIPEKIHTHKTIGKINGLYACDEFNGGIIPIHCKWIPSNSILQIKLTGNLGKIMSESADVALCIAWNYISVELQNKHMRDWKENGKKGIHINCSDASQEKEGPSAGCALTVAIISLLSNYSLKQNVGITGEIDLNGDVKAIGGLKDKLYGAKKAGCTLVLCPKENSKDIDEIRKENSEIFEDSFKVILINNINEALLHSV